MADNEGTVTPYGVVYDNGMQMELLYKGKEFPAYLYEPCLMTVTMTPVHQTDGPENTTLLFLPAADQQIQRAMVRAGINSEDDARFYIDENRLPKNAQWDSVIERESIFALNRLCQVLKPMEPKELEKLRAGCLVIDLASLPGGVDLAAAERLGVKAVRALSLPGKVAPATAAAALGTAIRHILDELGV